MSDETVLASKSVPYGYLELVKRFSSPGTITYWIKENESLKHGAYSDLGPAQRKFASLG